MPHLQGDRPGAEQMKLPDNISRQTIYAIIDELMTALKTIQPRLYDAVLSKL